MKRLFVFVYMMLFAVIGMSAQSITTDGDVNNDGHVNYTDVDMISDIIMGKLPYSDAADINKDGKVDASDIVEVINVIKANINQIAEDIEHANSVIVPLFLQCESIFDLSQHLSTIKDIEGVENAWTDNQTLFVKIRNYNTILFSYPPAPHSVEDLISTSQIQSLTRSSDEQSQDHTPINAQKACVYYQMEKNDSIPFQSPRKISQLMCDNFNNMGIPCQRITNGGAEFFSKDIFEYDLIFLITHGCYDQNSDTHWLFTSNEIRRYDENSQVYKELDFDEVAKMIRDEYYPQYGGFVTVGWQKEERNGKKNVVFYTCVSDKFIDYFKLEFQNHNAIIFNAACQSLKKNDKLANVFINKGAACYLGYTDTNAIGHGGGYEFFSALLNGSCIGHAKESIFLKEDVFFYDGHTYHPELKMVISDNDVLKQCVTHVETLTSNELTSDKNNSIRLNGRIKRLKSFFLADNYKYGFQWSTNSDMSQAESKESDAYSYDDATLYMNWELTLTDKDLKPNTTYYYRAYMNDGDSYCYGDIKSFTTTGDEGGEQEAYTVLDGETLTFYYDNKKNERTGEISSPSVLTTIGKKNYKGWMYNGQSDIFVNKVVKVVSFDPSFQKYTPQTTDYWFSLYTKLTTIKNLKYLNTTNVTSMFNMFFGCSSLTDIDLSSFNTSNVTDMGQLFKGCRSLKNLNLSSFNTTNVTNMSSMFSGCSSLNSLDLSSFNTKNVTNMCSMFYGCSSLTSLDLSSFNTTKVPDMSTMFYGCSSLTSLDISSFNTANVTNMSKMFSGCSSLTNLDLSGFNTKNVTDMSSMFSDCSSLTSLDMSGFSFANLTWIKRKDLFSGCSLLTTLNMSGCIFPDDISCLFIGCSLLTSLNLSKANTAAVTNMRSMFSGCSSLTSLDLSSFNTTNVTDMGGMFWGCSSLTSLDLSSFNTTNVTIMGAMFRDCSSLTSLDLSSFNTANVTNMSSMFSGCSSLKILDMRGLTFPKDISSLFYGLSSLTNLNLRGANITNVTGTSYLFYGCSSLTDLDMSGVIFPKYVSSFFCRSLINLNLSGANFANATDMSSTFSGCSSLTNIDMSEVIFPDNISGLFSGKSLLTNLNLSGVNTTNVTNMSFMFSGCSSLTGLNLSSFNTANVTNMGAMFGGCSSLNNLNLSSFNTANVTNMGAMFSGCSSLNSLDLSGFNTTNVTDMGGMFYGCSSLKTIFANWKVHGYGSKMFFGCDELVGGKGTKIGDNLYGYDQYGNPLYYQCGTDSFAAHVDGGKDNPGLFTAK